MASRQHQRQQQRRAVETHVSAPVRIESSSGYQEEEPMNYYSVIGLRTWGKNYYDTVVKNSLASSGHTEVQGTPSPQKKPIHLTLSIPQECSSRSKNDDTVPDEMCKTPAGDGTGNVADGQSLPSTVSKHLNGMFDDIMKEVFREDGQGKTSQEEEGFRIAACPSPTRDVGSFRQPEMEEGRVDEVVLNMGDMSPLLERMREIDRARNSKIPLSKQPPSVADDAVDLEMQHNDTSSRNTVPSLVHFYDSRTAQKQSKNAPGKPPLPSSHGAVKYVEKILGPKYSKKMEHMVKKHVLPRLHRTTHGQRMIFAMIALAYLVAIHVYIITSRL